MNHILIPVDFSDNTDRQIEYLITHLKPQKALVTLLHGHNPNEDILYDPDDEETAVEQEAKQQPFILMLNDLAGHIRQALPDVVVQTSVREGLATEILSQLVQKEDFGLVVIGTHRHGPLHDLIVGSVAAAVIQNARCPVHIVPPTPLPAPQAERELITGIDIWSPEASEVIRQAVGLAKAMGIPALHLLHAEKPDSSEVYREWSIIRYSKEERRTFLYERMDKLLEETFADGSPGVEFLKQVEFGAPVPVLRRRLAVQRPAALVLGAHRHGPMHDIFLGSVSRKLVKKADIPIIIVPGALAEKTANGVQPALSGDQQVDFMRYFPGLDRVHRERLLSHSKWVGYKKDQPILQRGDPADTFYFVLSGSVDLMGRVGIRSKFKVQEATAGSLVGFSWVCPEPFWTLDAFAGEDCELLAFDARAVLRDCEADASFAVQVMQTFCGLILERLNALRDNVALTSNEWSTVSSPAETLATT